MEYLSKVKELRKKVPIPITVAINLLKQNNGDLALCEQSFISSKNSGISNTILEICQQTGCSEEMARQKYIKSQFDSVRAVRSIQQ